MRQFKIEVVYPVAPTAQLYWHDNGTIEFITLPQIAASDLIGLRTTLIEQIINFMKAQGITSLEINKVP